MNRKRIEKILHNCSKTIDESVNRVGASNEIVKYIEDLEQQVEKQKEVINKAVLELVNIDGNLSNSQLSDRICNLIDILKEVSEWI